MITNEKYLLYILGVNKGQLDYLLAHIEDYYYSFERVKFNKFTDKPKKNSNGEIATRQINSSRGKLKEVQTRLYELELAKKYDFITIADWYQVAIENPNIWVGTDSVHFNMETNGGELYAQTVKEALDKAEKGPVKK